MYPHPGLPYSGIFNRNCVEAMQRHGHELVVLAPRPFVPGLLAVHPRWSAYARIPRYSEHGGVKVYRPNLIQLPRYGATFQRNQGAFLQMRGIARRLHREQPFDAVFSFDLGAAGGLAWRLGHDLKLPATGWAFGLDVRVPPDSTDANELRKTLERLQLVFYQSSELRDCAESYLHRQLDPRRHLVLPHGIPPMEPIDGQHRRQQREKLGFGADEVVLLFLSRMVASKGIHELLAAFELEAAKHTNLRCLAVGATRGFDESAVLKQQIQQKRLGDKLRLLPACDPEDVRGFHAAADIFGFPSKSEGMPNALLEAMALGTPAVVFDIPPIRDILSHGPCLLAAKSFDEIDFGRCISELASSTARRAEQARIARRVVTQHYDIHKNVGMALRRLQDWIT